MITPRTALKVDSSFRVPAQHQLCADCHPQDRTNTAQSINLPKHVSPMQWPSPCSRHASGNDPPHHARTQDHSANLHARRILTSVNRIQLMLAKQFQHLEALTQVHGWTIEDVLDPDPDFGDRLLQSEVDARSLDVQPQEEYFDTSPPPPSHVYGLVEIPDFGFHILSHPDFFLSYGELSQPQDNPEYEPYIASLYEELTACAYLGDMTEAKVIATAIASTASVVVAQKRQLAIDAALAKPKSTDSRSLDHKSTDRSLDHKSTNRKRKKKKRSKFRK